MTLPRQTLPTLVLLALVTPGCMPKKSEKAPDAKNTPAPSSPAARVEASANPGTPAGAADYRTLAKADLENLIRSKLGCDAITLVPNGPNRYTGRISAPGGDMLPVVVTVESERITCDTNTPAGSSRQVITPRGVDSNLNVR